MDTYKVQSLKYSTLNGEMPMLYPISTVTFSHRNIKLTPPPLPTPPEPILDSRQGEYFPIESPILNKGHEFKLEPNRDIYSFRVFWSS